MGNPEKAFPGTTQRVNSLEKRPALHYRARSGELSHAYQTPDPVSVSFGASARLCLRRHHNLCK
jgi:hypothetical protein